MDCEKFENLLIDELYGELDEVTSAAVRRHAAGCARCGALLSGLKATRKVLPTLPFSVKEEHVRQSSANSSGNRRRSPVDRSHMQGLPQADELGGSA